MVNFYSFPVSFEKVFDNNSQLNGPISLKNFSRPGSFKPSRRHLSFSSPHSVMDTFSNQLRGFVSKVSPGRQSIFSKVPCFVLITNSNNLVTLKSFSAPGDSNLCPLFFSKESALNYLTTLKLQNPNFVSSFDVNGAR